MHTPRSRGIGALLATAITAAPVAASAGYDAEVRRAWAEPSRVDAGDTITLYADVRNLTTRDTDYGGFATFIIEFEVNVPSQFDDDEAEIRYELAPNETRRFQWEYRTSNDGEYDVSINVYSSHWSRRRYDSYDFSFRADPDPCDDVECPDDCDGDVRLRDGRCVDGRCAYSRTNCDAMDTTGAPESYCRGSDVWTRRPRTDYSCSDGACDADRDWTDERLVRSCEDTCDGNTRVWARTCRSGSCTDGTRTDCNAHDATWTEDSCRGTVRWQRTFLTDYSCRSGTCDAAPPRVTSEWGVESCGWGCEDGFCRRNPCESVVCEDRCDGNMWLTDGSCLDGTCRYPTRTDCDTMDAGASEQYCNGLDIYARDRIYDYACIGNRCQATERTANEHRVTTCRDRCDGDESSWGQRCENGTCVGGTESDCNAHDTPGATVPYCSGTVLRSHDVHRDFSCGRITGRCDAGRDIIENDQRIEDCAARVPIVESIGATCAGRDQPQHTIMTHTWGCLDDACAPTSGTRSTVTDPRCDASERCEAGTCVPCESEWSCGSWDACDGHAFRTRACVNRHDCLLSERPVEREPCPCDVIDLRWNNADGSRLRQATDGDEVVITAYHEGHCAGIATRLEIWDDAWGPLRDTFVQDALFEFPSDVSPSTQRWRVVFDYREDRGWGHYHYEVRLPSFDAESNILDVGPYRDEGGEAIAFLTAHPPEPYSVSDALCLQGMPVTITDRCRELWERANLIAEIEGEEQLSDVVGFFLGVGTGEIIYNAACTLCAFGVGPAGVVCVVPDGFEPIECPIAAALVVCDTTVCLGFLGRYVSRAAGALWRRILELRVTRAIEPFLRSGFRTIAAGELRDDTAHFVLQNADDETIDVFARIDSRDPRRIVVERIRNHIKRYPGGDELLTFNEAWRTSTGRPILWWSRDLRPGHGHEIELMTSLFQDGFLQDRLHPLIADLTRSRYTADDLITQIRFQEAVTGSSGSEVLGLTTPATTHRMLIDVNLRKLNERFGERARSVTVHYLFPHELSHAATMHHLLDQGHTLAPTGDGVGQALYYAREYLNDVHALTKIREPYRGEFYDSMRLGIRKLTEASGSSELQDRVRTTLSAIDRGGIPERSGAYAIVEALARSHKLGMVAEERTIWHAIDDELARYPAEFRERARTAIGRLTTDIVADGDRYAAHVLDDRYDDAMLELLCIRYQFIVCPTGHGDAPVVVDDPEPPAVLDPSSRDGGSSLPEPLVPSRDAGSAGTGGTVVDDPDWSGSIEEPADPNAPHRCYRIAGTCANDGTGMHWDCTPLPGDRVCPERPDVILENGTTWRVVRFTDDCERAKQDAWPSCPGTADNFAPGQMGPVTPPPESGCACRTDSRQSNRTWWALLALTLGARTIRNRSRRSLLR